MNTYIARLFDRGALSEPIYWRTTSIAEAREVLANVGVWQTAPDWEGPGHGGQILLSEGAVIDVFDDAAPFNIDDDLVARVDGMQPRLTFSIGPRGGIRRYAW